MLKLWTSTAACALIAAATSPAFAQTAALPAPTQQTATDDQTASTVDEIIVTAQRRSERLQDVPVTVTVFGQEEIRNARIQEFGDVAQRTPGLTFDAFPAGQPRPFVRGIGSVDKGAAGDPSSAVFVDEVYMGRPAAIAFDAFDIQQIEVLKGPQGTLFGRNVVGGAVSVTTRRPDPTGFDASVEATYGNYDRTDLAGYVNVPVAQGEGAVRASASWRKHDGYAQNSYTGGEADNQDTLSGRLQFLVNPNAVSRIQLSADYTRDQSSSPAQYVFDREPGSSRAGLWTVNRDRDAYAAETDGYQNRETWGARGQVDLDLGFGSLIYIGSYRDLDYALSGDFDGGNPTFNRAGISGGNAEQTQFWSNELRLVSPDSSPIKWVAGIYAFNQRVVRQDAVSIYARASLTAPVPSAIPTDVYDQRARLDSIAAFADVTAPLGERLRVFGGLRYSNDDKDFYIANDRSTALFRASERFAVTADASFDAVTWRAGADYKLAPDSLLYGVVSRGFKSGGYQDTPSSAVSAATPFQPEFATQYEVGLKSQFFDRRVTWNNTLYYTDYQDLQTRQVSGLTIITNNAGKATIKGYETALSLRPTDRIGLDASYAYTDARFDDYVEVGVDLAGNRLSRAPEHKLVISPNYTFPLNGGGELLFAADYQYTSKVFDDNSNGPIEVQEPVDLVDARVVFTAPGNRYQVSLWGKNLTDETYRTFQAQFFGANFGAYAAPRTYGITLRASY